MDDIIVCIKQVPNIRNVSLNQEYHTLIREGIPNILNPHDEYALNAAIECKKRFGIKIGAVTMGPPQAKEILEYCLKKGIDSAFLITDKRIAGSDTIVTARILASFISKTNFKNIFCGQESLDSGTGHIGPSLGELLNLPQMTYVNKITQFYNNKLRLSSETENGQNIIEVELPAVISFNRDKKKSKNILSSVDNRKIKIIDLDDLGMDEEHTGIKGSLTQVIKVNVDESLNNYLKVPDDLPALKKINYVIAGGIVTHKKKKLIKGSSDEDILRVIKVINLYKPKTRLS
jgi:electron transfer flavoprotein beta subunit